MKKISIIGALLLTACVTINIYFPAAAAEKAADQIIKDIQQTTDSSQKPQSDLQSLKIVFYRLIDGILNVVISPAHAQQADLSIDSPEIRRLTASMQNRFSSLKPYYDAGYIGIGSDGLLVVRDPFAVPLRDRTQVNRLVAAENADRNKLYQAIANANGQPNWFAQIKSTFAARWIGNARSGWWYQAPNGSWRQK
ncbi:YdbL family protein [Methylotuvimicrobium sp. KM2]|uniref:YdbL family protein n=1 Tax=Methylotuvimicrobium sp. KM2 TaxID=3133976 RepID=UPI003100E648